MDCSTIRTSAVVILPLSRSSNFLQTRLWITGSRSVAANAAVANALGLLCYGMDMELVSRTRQTEEEPSSTTT